MLLHFYLYFIFYFSIMYLFCFVEVGEKIVTDEVDDIEKQKAENKALEENKTATAITAE